MSEIEGKYKENTENDERRSTIQVNSLDYLVSVDRMPIYQSTTHGIYHYGRDNNYPRKIIQSSERSSKLVASKKTLAEFIQGLGFPGANAADVKNGTAIKINRNNETAYDLLKFCADQKSNINIAIHVNYNALGEAVEFNMIDYTFVRRKVRLKEDKYIKYIITNIWHLENDYTTWGNYEKVMAFNKWMDEKETTLSFTALECFDYNPDPVVVREQIEISGGIENYPGQLFYMKRTKDIYQKALYDSVADDFQFLAESKLASLSNIQNGYSAGGIFKHFGDINSTKGLEELRGKLKNSSGAINYGRTIAVEIPQNGDGNIPSNMFESTQLQNIDKLYSQQKEDARNNIQELFRQPSALLGKESKGNLAIQDHEDAFKIYNGRTEQLRQELEIELTTLFSNSIFASQMQLPIEIEPLQFNLSDTEEGSTEKVDDNTETETVEENE